MPVAGFCALLDDASFECELLALHLEDLSMAGVLRPSDEAGASLLAARIRTMLKDFALTLPKPPSATAEANKVRRERERKESANGRA